MQNWNNKDFNLISTVMDLREGFLWGEAVGRNLFGVQKTQVLVLIRSPSPPASLFSFTREGWMKPTQKPKSQNLMYRVSLRVGSSFFRRIVEEGWENPRLWNLQNLNLIN